MREELGRGRAGAGVPGSVIGLALVKVVVHRHGGSVDLRSRLGHGTSVFVHLPTRVPGARNLRDEPHPS